MSDQTEGAGREPPGDESFSWSLRPRRLAEYIGQVQVVDNLGIALAAAKSR
ncbi:MAG: Holliday junction branch migration DNA helicase RuvB, partial [Chloroflexi bacterium]|nr:Holliday junction branch migration DNA helicase RuvB [Chloroflexota bacterium]